MAARGGGTGGVGARGRPLDRVGLARHNAGWMTTARRHHEYSIAEFVRLEGYSNVRHEFVDGQIYAMAGGSPEHGTYAANVIGLLTAALRGRPCRVQTSDVRVRVRTTGLDTYPDVSVVCGRVELDPEDTKAVTNPIVLVEVLSESTEDYDRGDKLESYKQIPSLREVVLVDWRSERVEVVSRSGPAGWATRSAGAGERVRLESIDVELAVDDVYLDPLATG